MRAGRLLTINRDNIVLSKSKEELEELGEDFVSLPLHLRKTDEEERIFHESSQEESKEEKIEDIEIIESFEEIPQNDVQEEDGENDEDVAIVRKTVLFQKIRGPRSKTRRIPLDKDNMVKFMNN